MSPADVLAVALGALRVQRRRTLLSLLGVSIGVAAVLLLTGAGAGARTFLRSQLAVIGTDVVGILPGKVETTGGVPGFGGVPNDLTLADARALERGVPGVAHVAPVSMGNELVAHGGRSRRVLVVGSTAELRRVQRIEVRSGSFLTPGPWERGEAEVVLGATVAAELFPAGSPLGELVRVGGWRLRVVGVLAPRGLHFGMDLDETVFVPVSTALEMFDESSLFRVALQVRPGWTLDGVVERARALLTERHGEEDVTVTTPDAILGSLESLLAVLTAALVGIASISLAVAGIGIMNVMLVSVSERTREIGLMKAVGASRRQVLAVFLTEAALLSGLGGLLGLVLGSALLWAAARLVPAFPFQLVGWSALLALGVAVGVGLAFGAWPAARALRLDPVAALTGRAR